jgi:hypothetical protein
MMQSRDVSFCATRRSRNSDARFALRVVDLSHVVDEILGREPTNRTRLVAVDGRAGSGKTTLARRLAARLDAPVATTDDFLSWTDLAGWWSRFEAEVVAPLLAGHDAHYRARDWKHDPEGNSVAGTKTTPWAPVVILEGVTSSRRDVTDRLCYRIWVDTPDKTRRQRCFARDGDYWQRHWVDWQVLETAFFDRDGAPERADLIVVGDPAESHDPETEVVTR